MNANSLSTILNIFVLFAGTFIVYRDIRLQRALSKPPATEAVHYVPVGASITSFHGLALDGTLKRVEFPSSEKKTLLITFSPDCPTCAFVLPRQIELAKYLRGSSSWRIVWVSRASTSATNLFATSHALPVSEVIADPQFVAAQVLRLESVPQMMVVDQNGRVLQRWIGKQAWTL